jgi:hypothetical protein
MEARLRIVEEAQEVAVWRHGMWVTVLPLRGVRNVVISGAKIELTQEDGSRWRAEVDECSGLVRALDMIDGSPD